MHTVASVHPSLPVCQWTNGMFFFLKKIVMGLFFVFLYFINIVQLNVFQGGVKFQIDLKAANKVQGEKEVQLE